MTYNLAYDVSRFLDASMHEVIRTLIEAFVLVSLVVFIFLQDWRLHAHPGAGRARVAGRYVFLHAAAGLFGEPAHPVCPGARPSASW
jgi:hypothetical protein